MQVARHEYRERRLTCSAFLGGESNIQWFVFLFVHCLLGFMDDTYIDTFVCRFVGFFRWTFQPHSRRPSIATAYSPCRDTAGETDNQVSVATNQWPLGHESLSTDQPADCLTSFGLSVQINNKMSVLVSFFSHVAACGVVVVACGVVPIGFRVDILPNFAPERRGLSVGVLPDGF